MARKIIIIGAGPGGLASGMILAHRGYEVSILEKAPRVGGRNAALQLGPYTFDTGPTFLHQKFTLDEIFAEAGADADSLLDFVKLDPMTTLSWGDHALETSCEPAVMAANIEKAFPGEGANYERFMRDHEVKLRKIFPCLLKPYHKLGNYAALHMLKALPYVATTKSVMDVLGEYFTDERLKLAFTFQAKYLGMSPWDCPGLFSILSYIEYAHGIYHVQGGLSEISTAMAETFTKNGGRLELGAEVDEILFSGDQATGVRLKNGGERHADHLIVNADYAHARSHLFGSRNESPESLRKKKYSCSTFMLYLGLDKIYENEPHHHVIFADDYHRNLRDIQSEERISDDMSIYVRNSSVTDPRVAPPGHSQLYLLVPTINTRHGHPWEDSQEAYRERVLDRVIARTGMKDLREHIVAEKILTPKSWEQADIFLGATFNLAHTMGQMLYFRPHNKLQNFDNIYLAGGGTHPGSGLPTIYESARITANLIAEADHGSAPTRVDYATPILQKNILP